MSEHIPIDWKEVEREFRNDRERRFPALELPSSIIKNELNDYNKWKPELTYGDHFLYQIIYKKNNEYVMSYPKMGMFISYNIADQAVVYDFATPLRTWEWRFKSKIAKYWQPEPQLISHIEWSDSIYIFKIWKSYPDWKEMKKAYRETFYFRLDRKLKIKRVLGSE